MSKRLLLVDDEEIICKINSISLRNKGFEVDVASDGAEAVEKLQQQQFDLVLSDFRMPNMNGLELFDWVHANQPNVNFILMTGFSEITSENQALERGMDGFIAKPFSKKSLLAILNEVLGLGEDAPAQDVAPEELYTKVPIDNFLVGFEIPYRVYISLGKKKYIKIAHTGESLDESRVATYRAKGIEFLYLRKEDFNDFVGFNMQAVQDAEETESEMSKQQKAQVMSGVSQVLYEKVMADGFDDETYKVSLELTELSLRSSIEDETILNIVDRMKEASLTLFEHSLFVSSYSVILAKALGHIAMKDLFAVSLGGFFHDVGKTHLSPEMHEMDPADFNDEQKEEYRKHPETGMKILENASAIPDEVLDIILQHEDAMMTLAVKRMDMKVSLAHIVCIANKICQILPKVNPGPDRFAKTVDELFVTETNIDEELMDVLSDLADQSRGIIAESEAGESFDGSDEEDDEAFAQLAAMKSNKAG